KEKEKKFTDAKMSHGMRVMDQIPVPLHIVLGNHDIENCKMLEMQMVKPSGAAEPSRASEPSKASEPSGSPEPLVKNWTFKSNLYSTRYIYNENIVRLIVIDTNVINNYNPEKYPESQSSNDYDMLKKSGCRAVD